MDRVGPDEFSGFELADYEESIQSAITASLKGSGGDLMPYFSEQRNPGVKAKVLSAIPSVELRDGELMGCTTVRLKEPLDKAEMSALQEYLLGQFSDGWGEGFEQREIALDGGRELYVHLWQDEDWSIRTEQERFEPYRDKLPQLCFTLLPGTGQLICVKRGESGYYPSDWSTPDAQENRRIADEQNRKLGVTPSQEEAMKIGSMCGWDVPGADPDHCMDIVQQRGGMELG